MEVFIGIVIGLVVLSIVISLLGLIFGGIGALGWWNVLFIGAIVFTSIVPPVAIVILGIYLLIILRWGLSAKEQKEFKEKEIKKFNKDTKEMTTEEILEYRLKELEAREYYVGSSD